MGNKRRSLQPAERSKRYVLSQFYRTKIGEEGAERVLKNMGAVFQRDNTSQEIVCPTIGGFFSRLIDEEKAGSQPSSSMDRIARAFAPDKCPIPATYKGVSFNPLLPKFGERFDLLDFFAWGSRVQQAQENFRFLVLDASKYWIVNAMGSMPVETYSKDAGRNAVARLRRELENGAVSDDIRKSASIRGSYLGAMASLMPNGTCQVLGADDLWSGNDAYAKSLQAAIDFVALERNEGAPFRFARAAQYSRYNQEYQKWYTPLVLAEADYLRCAYGISAKLGPTSEVAFDSLIQKMMGGEYGIFWYTRPLERQLPYPEYVFFDDTDAAVRRKMEGNRQLSAWLTEIAQPFFKERISDAVGAVNGLREKIRELAKNPSSAPSTPGDWWFLWPPGSCG
jgi:hypothetical protein